MSCNFMKTTKHYSLLRRLLYSCFAMTEEQAAKQNLLRRVRTEFWDLNMVGGS